MRGFESGTSLYSSGLAWAVLDFRLKQIDGNTSLIGEGGLRELEKALFGTIGWISPRKVLQLVITAAMAGERWRESWSFASLTDVPPRLRSRDGETDEGEYGEEDDRQLSLK